MFDASEGRVRPPSPPHLALRPLPLAPHLAPSHDSWTAKPSNRTPCDPPPHPLAPVLHPLSPAPHLASLSNTPRACRFSSARTMVSAGGGASHSNFMMLSMPNALS